MDGKYFYYHKSQEIWKVPVEGGEEALVTSEPTNFMNMWALGGHGIYFTEPRAAMHQMISAMGAVVEGVDLHSVSTPLRPC